MVHRFAVPPWSLTNTSDPSCHMGKASVPAKSVMGANPSTEEYKGASLLGDTLPVQNVSWLEAAAFANALSALEGLEACYAIAGDEVSWPKGLACSGYRLPTEAEWEYAARAGTGRPQREARPPFAGEYAARAGTGLMYAGTSEPVEVCRYGNVNNPTTKEKFEWSHDAFPCEDSHLVAAPAKSFEPNAWGLYDMTGNVWEWVWDWYGDYPAGSSTDPAGPEGGSYRVYRGGSWGYTPADARAAHRFGRSPGGRSDSLGLRLARSLP